MAPMTEIAADDAASGWLRPWQFFVLAGMLGATATVVVATGQSPASIVVLSITVVAAGIAGLALYRTLLPLVSPEAAEAPVLLGGRTRAALEREKALVLRSIKELEFDRAMGKVAQADFDEMGGRLRSRALGLIQQLHDGSGYRAQIERELDARLKENAVEQESAADEPAVGAGILVCEACGVDNDRDARFCKGCGTRLGAPPSVSAAPSPANPEP